MSRDKVICLSIIWLIQAVGWIVGTQTPDHDVSEYTRKTFVYIGYDIRTTDPQYGYTYDILIQANDNTTCYLWNWKEIYKTDRYSLEKFLQDNHPLGSRVQRYWRESICFESIPTVISVGVCIVMILITAFVFCGGCFWYEHDQKIRERREAELILTTISVPVPSAQT